MEKIYKTMQRTGACCLAVGVVILTAGITVGVCSIISGAILLKRKNEIIF